MEQNEIILEFPYKVPGKGSYLFDIVLTDLESLYGAKYRAQVKKRF